jgi:hypothetical protein
MEKIIIQPAPITIDLGSMQISREELDAIKLHLKTNSDTEAICHLVYVAENSFNRYVEQYT